MKTYVKVDIQINDEGQIRPLAIYWADGTRYEVQQVLGRRRAASTKAGGCGMMYTCMVDGSRVHLYCEDDNCGRWFVDSRTA